MTSHKVSTKTGQPPVMISYRAADDIGAKEIQKLIDILTAQKTALED